jgi:2-polyprenyl-3-methyl-5-hydroxy-6-metoxy-1,4-benzoquinol methylase
MNISTTAPRASRFFDSYARDFDAIYGNDHRAFDRVINTLFRRAMLVRFEKTIAGCAPIAGHSVLDVGCGPGHYSIQLAQAGASRVVGLDFAAGMLEIARKRAEAEGVADRCSFLLDDFLTHEFGETFDYGIVMGFMDYVKDPSRVIERVVGLVRRRAFFSFPADGGFLAWQRKVRYKRRCDLFLYQRERIAELMSRGGQPFTIESIGRDFFVTVEPRKPA